MKTRAELLAEIEEKRWKNNKINQDLNEFSVADPEAADGYDPYDHPGLGKAVRDAADLAARRRRLLERRRR